MENFPWQFLKICTWIHFVKLFKNQLGWIELQVKIILILHKNILKFLLFTKKANISWNTLGNMTTPLTFQDLVLLTKRWMRKIIWLRNVIYSLNNVQLYNNKFYHYCKAGFNWKFCSFFLIVCLPWWFQCLIAAECADAPNHDLVFQNYFTKHAVCAKAVSAEF